MAAPTNVGLRRICRVIADFAVITFLANVLTRVVSHVSDGVQGSLLCRKCGRDLADAAELMNIPSKLAHRQRNDTIAGKREVLIQLFKNPHDHYFELVSIGSAKLLYHEQAFAEDSWFPGYTWSIAVCPHCGQHIGWLFKLLPGQEDAKKLSSFVGVIFEKIIHDSFADSIIAMPKAYTS